MFAAQVSSHFWWYVARASGITAGVALLVTVVWGLLLVTKVVQRRGLPAWLDALHRHLGALTLSLVAVHLFALWADSYTHFTVPALLVPFVSSWRPWATAAGVVAMWLLVVVEGTSLVRRRLPRRLWRGVHLTSYLATVLALVHTVTAGHDVSNRVFVPALAALVAVTGFLVVVRTAGGRQSRAEGLTAARVPARDELARAATAEPSPGAAVDAPPATAPPSPGTPAQSPLTQLPPPLPPHLAPPPPGGPWSQPPT